MSLNFFGRKKTEKGIRQETLPEAHHEFPDSNKPYGLCPRCNKQSSFDLLGTLPGTYEEAYLVTQSGTREQLLMDRVTSLNCRNCQQPTIVFEEKFIADTSAREKHSGGIISWRGFFWWPFLNVHSVKDVPSEITAALMEAKTCYSAQCFRASAVMARRTLEAIIADKNASEKSLYAGIKKLKELEIIDKNLLEWATEVRLIGNNGAHFDPIDSVTKEDAQNVILFIEQLIKFIYSMPAEIARRRNGGNA